jgi:hypothetical protein
MMALVLKSASRRLGRAWTGNRFQGLHQMRRGFASVGDGKEVDTLPLSGIRVLDMTRVLAGVGVGTHLKEHLF